MNKYIVGLLLIVVLSACETVNNDLQHENIDSYFNHQKH